MPLGRQPRDNYDPLDRTFYYLRPRTDHSRIFSIVLIRRSYYSMRFWIEM
jgi:hypothetical protein